MIEQGEKLRLKFAELLRWEKRKRLEQILLEALCYAFAVALVLIPLYSLWPLASLRWLLPLILMMIAAPAVYYRRRWSARDTARAVVGLDHSLGLEERAVTAWDMLAANVENSSAAMIYTQAGKRMEHADARRLFPRVWQWPAYLVLPLLLLWIGLLVFDDANPARPNQPPHAVPSAALKLKEFARELQEKAKAERLPQTQKLGKELEQVAQRAVEEQTSPEQLKKDLAGINQKIDAMGQRSAQERMLPDLANQQQLKDLQAEVDAARDLSGLNDGSQAPGEGTSRWLEQLANFPQLRRLLQKEDPSGRGMNRQQMQAMLNRAQQQVQQELDRRALLDAQQVINRLGQTGEAKQGEQQLRVAGGGEQAEAGAAKEKNFNPGPGSEPGSKAKEPAPLPQFKAAVQSQIKGLLGAGERSGLVFKGDPKSGTSRATVEEVVAAYQRQAEEALHSEPVPNELKQTIRDYFLSLENNGAKRDAAGVKHGNGR